MFNFETVSPESLGISSSSILAFIEREKEHSIEMHSLQILRHGKRCFFGVWAPYTKDDAHILFSFSKALTSTAIGFAEQEGILSLDEKLVDIFPDDLPDTISENLAKADIYSLLTMSCGHASEVVPADARVEGWIRAFLAHEFRFEPGTTFLYNTAGTNMLAAILKKKTGQNVTEFLKPRLLDVIGIPPVDCWMLPGDIEMGGAGMYLTPDSMARFAQFVLNFGAWEGRQLLNRGWFERATSYQINTLSEVSVTDASEWMQGYGFQFWGCSVPGSFRADGAYGQLAVCLPEQDAAIVVNSASNDANLLMLDLYDTVVASMQDTPLPDDPALLAALRSAEDTLSIPALWGIRNRDSERALEGVRFRASSDVPAFTEIAGGSGRPFESDAQLSALSFSFGDSAVTVTVEEDAGTYTFDAPFSGRFLRTSVAGRPYAFSARWADASILVIDTRSLNAATGTRLILTFDDAGLTITTHSSLPADRALLDTLAAEPIRLRRE